MKKSKRESMKRSRKKIKKSKRVSKKIIKKKSKKISRRVSRKQKKKHVSMSITNQEIENIKSRNDRFYGENTRYSAIYNKIINIINELESKCVHNLKKCKELRKQTYNNNYYNLLEKNNCIHSDECNKLYDSLKPYRLVFPVK